MSSTGRLPIDWSAVRHAAAVVGGYTLLFTWVWARPLAENAYLAGTDLFDYYLPVFLSPITTWSTYELSGLPAFADSQNATFYPVNLLFARVFHSWTGYIVAAYVLAASFTYAYIYDRTRCVAAAAFAGLAYGLSEALIERVEHLSIVHAAAWLPLIALAIDRLRGAWHAGWVAVGAFAVASCFLAGHTQPSIYIAATCGVYALVGGIAGRVRFSYYAAIVAIFAAGGLLAAVSLLPLWEAGEQAVRQTVNFGQFVSHSNTPAQMLSSLLPGILHEGREAPTYVGLAVIVFALAALRGLPRQWPVAFWLAVAVVGLMAGAGDATPVAAWLYEVPFYDRFRVVARHLVLAAFALAALGGFGVSAVRSGRCSRAGVAIAVLAVTAAVAGAAMAVARWPAVFELEPYTDTAVARLLPLGTPGVQLLVAVGVAAVCLVFGWRPRARLATAALLAVLAVDLLHAQPYAVTAAGLQAPVVPAAAVQPSVHAAELGRAIAPQHQRLLAPSGATVDPVIRGSFARLWRIPVANTYGAIITQSYAALAAMGTTGAVEPHVLSHDNTALDLLAVRYILVARRELVSPEHFEARGVRWASARIDLPAGPEECGQTYPRTASFGLPDVAIRSVLFVSALRCSDDVVQGTEVATVSVAGADGQVHRFPLRAGIETADATVALPDGRRRGRHDPADLFAADSDGVGYVTRIDLPRPATGARLDFRVHGTAGWLQLQRLTVIDDSGASVPVGTSDALLADRSRWRIAKTFRTSAITDRGADRDTPGEEEIVVLENLRARPRAWLAREVVPLGERDMLTAVHHSYLPDGRRFDAARMALVAEGEAPPETYGDGEAEVRVQTVEDGLIRVAVTAADGGFLVLSESYYPGWQARIGDRQVPIRRTDVSLQGVTLPPGAHVVTFELESATLRAGAIASVATLAGLAVLLAWSAFRFPSRPRPAAQTISATSAAR